MVMVNIKNKKLQTFRFFTIVYLIALMTIAVVTIVSQLVIQGALDRRLEDSHVVNIAGRQRMYSQKITKLCLQVERGTDGLHVRQQLERSLRLWMVNHEGLRGGALLPLGSELGTERVSELFVEIDPFYEKVVSSVEIVMGELKKSEVDLVKIKAANEGLLEAELFFLQYMDDIVNEYDVVIRRKVEAQKRTEYVLMFITLGVLVAEVVFIFQPAARRIKSTINSLVQSENQASDTAVKLNSTNAELEEIIRQNRDINFALVKATVMIRTDQYGNILYANDKYCSITKYKEHELTGKPLFFNNSGGEESVIYEHIRDKVKRVTVWQGEILDQAKDGANFWLDVTMIPIEDSAGELYQFLVVSSNITARKEAEDQLMALNERRLKRQRDEQKLTSHAIITGQEKERRRMAAEIHDGVGQQLTALKFSCQALSPVGKKQEAEFAQMENLIYDTIKEVRRISSNILPTALTDYGLGPSIKELVGSIERSVPCQIKFVDELKLGGRLSTQVEVTLYRVAQEAINNALKHSGANLIQITLNNTQDFLNLTIKDDGVGFDQELVFEKSKERSSGNGLTNMRERAQLINARITIEGVPDLGVIVAVQLPLTTDLYVKNSSSTRG